MTNVTTIFREITIRRRWAAIFDMGHGTEYIAESQVRELNAIMHNINCLAYLCELKVTSKKSGFSAGMK